MRFKALSVPEKIPAGKLAVLKRVYVVMVLPPPDLAESPDGSASRVEESPEDEERRFEAASRPPTRVEAKAILLDVLAALGGAYSGAAGSQFAYSQDPPALASGLRPSAVLWILPSEIKGDRGDQDDPIYDAAGIQTGARKVLKFEQTFTLGWRLAAWPSGETVSDGSFYRIDGSTEAGKKTLAVWMSMRRDLLKGFKADFEAALLPHETVRSRDLAPGRGDAAKAALKAADGGDWDRAERFWKEDAKTSSDYASDFNLGVAAERRGQGYEALEHYRSALEKARSTKAEGMLRACVADLEPVAALDAAPAPPSRMPWFEDPLAVLPVPGSGSGPAAVRTKVFDELRRKGYAVEPVIETDRRLAAKGAGMPEEAAARAPEDLARLLGPQRSVAVAVSDYALSEADPARAHVQIAARLLDAAGSALWSGAGESQKDAPARRLAQADSLAASQAAPNLSSLLGAASAAAVQWTFETLPSRAALPPPAAAGPFVPGAP